MRIIVPTMNRYPWTIKTIFKGKPTLGGHVELCHENYRLLKKLAPGICDLSGVHLSRSVEGLVLRLEVLEQTPYTTLIHLTYLFSGAEENGDPDAVVRIYHDASLAEIQQLKQSNLPTNEYPSEQSLMQKWRVSQFFSRWLNYCLSVGHCFTRPGEIKTEKFLELS